MRFQVIAEIGCNYRGFITLAEEYIKAAKGTGCAYAKFQYYRTEEVRDAEKERVKQGLPSYYTPETFEAIKKAELNLDQLSHLEGVCEDEGIEFLCTPYLNPELVEDLSCLGTGAVKIRERDSHNYEMIKMAIDLFDEVFISVTERPADPYIEYHPNITLLYCIPKYPPSPSDFNLDRADYFGGVSLHYPHITYDLAAAIKAMDSGYEQRFLIEKHFKLEEGLIDDAVSITPTQMRELTAHLRRLEELE